MMDSVRYLSYHQWRARKEDGVNPLQYHDKLLANVECLQDKVTSIDKHIKEYLDVTKSFCEAGSHIAEAFCMVLKDTPLSEITQQLKQVVEEMDHVGHKSSLHIMNHILGALCEFTATFPDLKRAIETHKRSAQNYESCQENIEALDRDETLSENSKRFKIAKKRFRSADEELSTEEENLYRSFTEVEENRVKMLGSCFLSLLQVQSQYLTDSSDLMSPVGSFQEIGDYLRDREVTLALKDATAAWLSLAQANQGLRQGKELTRYDVHLLTHSNDEDISDSERKQLAIRVELLFKNYQKEFERVPTPEADIPGGFLKHPKGVELALKGCCSETEALAAGGQLEILSREEMEAGILKRLPKLHLKIGSVIHETCPSPSKAPDNLKSKLQCIRDLVNKVATHNDIPLNKENLDQFVATVLYEACSPVCVSSAKTTVQLLFGKANLVTIKPCKENSTRQAQVFVKSTSIHVEVMSTWSITVDQPLFSCLSRDLDLNAILGTVDAICVAKFSLMDFLEDKERLLPTIYIKKHSAPQSPSAQSKQESSPSHKQNRFRKSLTKATSKIFSRKSAQGAKQAGSATAVVESPTSSAPSAGTSSTSPENEAYRMSLITSSTETSNDHDADMENFAPLPPPRPKHWARKVRQQNMGDGEKMGIEASKKCEDNRDDWFSTDPKFPLPKFKPTLSDSQSQLSVASQQELDEVIKFLSGTPFKQMVANVDNVDNSSHITPADSGLGSTLSIALSSATQPTTAAAGSNIQHDITPTAIATPPETTKELKKDTKARKGKNTNKLDSDTKKENGKGDSSKGKNANKKADKSSNNNKGQDIQPKDKQPLSPKDCQRQPNKEKPEGPLSPKDCQGQPNKKKPEGPLSPKDCQGQPNKKKPEGPLSPKDCQGQPNKEKPEGPLSPKDYQGQPNKEKSEGPLSPKDCQRQPSKEKSEGPFSPKDCQGQPNKEKLEGPLLPKDCQGQPNKEKPEGPLSPKDCQGQPNKEKPEGPFSPKDCQGQPNKEKSEGPLSPKDCQGQPNKEKSEGPLSPKDCCEGQTENKEKSESPLSPKDCQGQPNKEKSEGPFSPKDCQRQPNKEKPEGPFSPKDCQRQPSKEKSEGPFSPKDCREGQTENKEKPDDKMEKGIIQENESKACPSPVVVTVSSVGDDQDKGKKVSISESLRSVWENAEPSCKKQNENPSATALQCRKEKYGSQETLYHSCWSLSEFNEKEGHKDDDTRSLNENLLPSNASPVMDLGLKWSIGFTNDVWSSNPNVSDSNEMEAGQWRRSDESLDRTNHGGKSAFSLGLGITGPELFAAASQAGRDDHTQAKGLCVPDMSKPWSTEDLTSKDPWPRRGVSPSQQLQWSKTTSLTDESQRQNIQRQTLPPQHYSDPFLPQEHWWSQVGPGLPHPSHPRYQQYLQRQYSVDVNFQGMQENTVGGYPQAGLSAFHQVQPRLPKPTRPAHLQVPSHQYPNGNGSHHASNPRF